MLIKNYLTSFPTEVGPLYVLRGCLYEASQLGSRSCLGYFLLNFILHLHENRAGPPNRGPALCDPRPRLNGLGSFPYKHMYPSWLGF
jgi:hypothetical protein